MLANFHHHSATQKVTFRPNLNIKLNVLEVTWLLTYLPAIYYTKQLMTHHGFIIEFHCFPTISLLYIQG